MNKRTAQEIFAEHVRILVACNVDDVMLNTAWTLGRIAWLPRKWVPDGLVYDKVHDLQHKTNRELGVGQ